MVVIVHQKYLEAIGYSSFPERDSEVTLQKLSMNNIVAFGFHNNNLAIPN